MKMRTKSSCTKGTFTLLHHTLNKWHLGSFRGLLLAGKDAHNRCCDILDELLFGRGSPLMKRLNVAEMSGQNLPQSCKNFQILKLFYCLKCWIDYMRREIRNLLFTSSSEAAQSKMRWNQRAKRYAVNPQNHPMIFTQLQLSFINMPPKLPRVVDVYLTLELNLIYSRDWSFTVKQRSLNHPACVLCFHKVTSAILLFIGSDPLKLHCKNSFINRTTNFGLWKSRCFFRFHFEVLWVQHLIKKREESQMWKTLLESFYFYGLNHVKINLGSFIVFSPFLRLLWSINSSVENKNTDQYFWFSKLFQESFKDFFLDLPLRFIKCFKNQELLT